MSVSCKSCGSSQRVKNGFIQGKQRYKCKSCGMNYVPGDKRVKYSEKDRLKVLKLYLENCGIRSIERLTGIHNSLISHWIRDSAAQIRRRLLQASEEISSPESLEIMEVDELCTYIKKDLRTEESSPSYGLLLIGSQVKLLTLR